MQTELPVIWQNSDVVVINKPALVAMHDAEHGVISLAQQQLNLPQLWLVHRLDTPTSGCLILAKNKQTAQVFSQLFSEKQVQKYYLAVTSNTVKKKQGSLIGDMLKTRNGSWRLSQQRNNPAITHFMSHSLLPGYRLFVCKPLTGKTHQLRVAMKANGAAIVGDQRYKGEAAERLYLHCFAMEFCLNGEQIRVQCMPDDADLFAHAGLHSIFHKTGYPWDMRWKS